MSPGLRVTKAAFANYEVASEAGASARTNQAARPSQKECSAARPVGRRISTRAAIAVAHIATAQRHATMPFSGRPLRRRQRRPWPELLGSRSSPNDRNATALVPFRPPSSPTSSRADSATADILRAARDAGARLLVETHGLAPRARTTVTVSNPVAREQLWTAQRTACHGRAPPRRSVTCISVLTADCLQNEWLNA